MHQTSIDWLRFRTQGQPSDVVEAIRPAFGELSPLIRLGGFARGALGFERSAQLVASDLPLARLDFGGESQRGWVRVDMSGSGCSWVRDWTQIENLSALDRAEIRRLDIAFTTYDGSVSHDSVTRAYAEGRFSSPGAGRPPVMRQITSSDPCAGRTVYVGNRASDKFARCYEKGFELLRKFPEADRKVLETLEGVPVADIYRCELELKASDRPIPWATIACRDEYFAGSYPYFSDIMPNVHTARLKAAPAAHAAGALDAALAHIRQQWGKTIFTALHALDGDIGELMSRIIGSEHSERLLQAGVLSAANLLDERSVH